MSVVPMGSPEAIRIGHIELSMWEVPMKKIANLYCQRQETHPTTASGHVPLCDDILLFNQSLMQVSQPGCAGRSGKSQTPNLLLTTHSKFLPNVAPY